MVTLNYDVIGILTTGSLEKCGRTVFKIVSPTDDFETIKNGIALVAKLLQYFPCLLRVQTDTSFCQSDTLSSVQSDTSVKQDGCLFQ